MYINPKNVQVTDHARKQYRRRVLSDMHDARTVNNVTEEQIKELIQEAVSQSKSGKPVRQKLAPWLTLFHQQAGRGVRDVYYHEPTHAVFLCTAPSICERVVITCFRATCKACGEHDCRCNAIYGSLN